MKTSPDKMSMKMRMKKKEEAFGAGPCGCELLLYRVSSYLAGYEMACALVRTGAGENGGVQGASEIRQVRDFPARNK